MAIYEVRIYPEHYSRKCIRKFTAADTDDYRGRAKSIINKLRSRHGRRYWVQITDTTTHPGAPVSHFIYQCNHFE